MSSTNQIILAGIALLGAGAVLPLSGWSVMRAARRGELRTALVLAALALGGILAAQILPLRPAALRIALSLLPATVAVIVYPIRSRQRVPFQLWVAIVWIEIFVFLGTFFLLAGFDNTWIRENAGFIARGLWVTVLIAVSSIVFATILALLGSLGRLSRNPIAYGVSGFYTSFFRGTPLIVQLFLIYSGVAQLVRGLNVPRQVEDFFTFEAVVAGIIGLSLNYGAYMTEIFRAGIQSVSHGQREAAEALGMNYRQLMRRVVLPQAFRVIIPPTGNEFIAMLKDTALVSFLGTTVAFMEIFRRAQLVGKADFKNLEAYVIAAGLYWGLTAIFSFFQAKLEKRVSRGYVRAAAETAAEGGLVTPTQPHGAMH
jgi:polar amino acid transport system permease protein